MSGATRFLWELAGRPGFATATTAAHLADAEAACAICGTVDPRTANADRALGANFSDRGHLTNNGSDRICTACLWCCSGKPPATLRMWSIVATTTHEQPASHPKAWTDLGPHVCLTNRAAPQPVRDILTRGADGDWLCTVAYSGQKHVIPYSPINHGRDAWTVRVEDHYVSATCAQFAEARRHADALRRLGVPEDAVMAGQPAYVKTPEALAAWKEHAQPLDRYLGSPLLRLALWTITKTTMQEESC